MNASQSLSQAYIEHHPADAARVIEQLPMETAQLFLSSLNVPQLARLFSYFVYPSSIPLFRHLDEASALGCLKNLPPALAGQLLRGLEKESAQLLNRLPLKSAQAIQAYLEYPDYAAGAIMSSQYLILPTGITVNDAIRRIERSSLQTSGEIYLVDEHGHLSGVIEAVQLLRHKRDALLNGIMASPAPFISDRSKLTAVGQHPAWAHFRTLPVVDKKGLVLGLINFAQVQQQQPLREQTPPIQNGLEFIAAMLNLYWLVLSSLAENLFGRHTDKPQG